MTGGNSSELANVLLLGFTTSKDLNFLLFIFLLSFYLLTITINMLIIQIINLDFNLQNKPMYIFLSHFSFLEILYTTVTIPKMLVDFIMNNSVIIYHGCIAQIYFFFALGLTELFFLAVMSYDRYLAVCHPLQYYTVMNSNLCNKLTIWSWFFGFLSSFFLVIPSSRLMICAPTTVNNFFCDWAPLLHIYCNKMLVTDKIFYVLAWIIILYSFSMTIASYIYIIKTVCKLLCTVQRRYAFSTCGSHLTVVITFYITILFMYIQPSSYDSLTMNKVMFVFYAVVVPFLNPLVYTLRNKEVQKAFWKALTKKHLHFLTCHLFSVKNV